MAEDEQECIRLQILLALTLHHSFPGPSCARGRDESVLNPVLCKLLV